MIGIFRANNPFNTFLLFLYGLLLKFYWFMHMPAAAADKSDGFLYQYLVARLNHLQPSRLVIIIIVYLLLFTQAMMINRLVLVGKMMLRPSFLPAASYLLMTSLFLQWNTLSSALIINSLLIWIWSKVNKLYNTQEPKTIAFNTGMIIGIASFIYFPVIGLGVLLLIALLLARPFRLREWITAIVGIIAPYYFLFVYLYLSGNLQHYVLPGIMPQLPWINITPVTITALTIIGVLFLLGSYHIQANTRKQVVQVRKTWTIMTFLLITLMVIALFYSGKSISSYLLTALPASLFVSGAFLYTRKKLITSILHWAVIGCIIAICYYGK